MLRATKIRRSLSFFAMPLLGLSQLTAASTKDLKGVILPESAASNLSRLCSRASPKFDGTWKPSAAIVATMESHLDDISKLGIDHPRSTFRQYIGLLIEGKRYIYINASCQKSDSAWHDQFMGMCDGGMCFWGVLYNVRTHNFSDLEVNGSTPGPSPQRPAASAPR